MVSSIKTIIFGLAGSLVAACTFVSGQNLSTEKDEALIGIISLIDSMAIVADVNLVSMDDEFLVNRLIEDLTGDSLFDEIIVVATRR